MFGTLGTPLFHDVFRLSWLSFLYTLLILLCGDNPSIFEGWLLADSLVVTLWWWWWCGCYLHCDHWRTWRGWGCPFETVHTCAAEFIWLEDENGGLLEDCAEEGDWHHSFAFAVKYKHVQLSINYWVRFWLVFLPFESVVPVSHALLVTLSVMCLNASFLYSWGLIW